MASRKECDKLEAMEREGQGREAFVLAMSLLSRDGSDETGRIFAIIERAAERHADAALTAAMSYRIFDREETRPGAISTYYEMAIAGDDEKIRRMATFGFARHLLDAGENGRGIRLMKMARRLGHAEAAAEMGSFYEKGSFGVAVDLQECVKCYVEAVEGDSGRGLFLLSQFMLSNTVKVRDYHPLDLLQRSAAHGYPEAVALVAQMADVIETVMETDPDPDMLSYVVVPDGTERIRLVREAMMNEFSVAEEEAGVVTALLHGYPDWQTLNSDALNADKPKGKFDEDCSAAEFNERERMQTEIFQSRTGCSKEAALTAIKLLRPTSRSAKPSLRRFDKIMEGIITRGLPTDLGSLVAETLKDMGVANVEKSGRALRTLWPLRVKTWLDVFETHGWSMRRRKLDASDGEQVAVSETSDGRLFKIYMSVVAYDPGDLGDEDVEELTKRIEGECQRAVLIFNHPRVSRIRGSQTRAAFYGGKILNNGSWSDFILRKSDGVDDALRQAGTGMDIQSPTTVTENAFEGAIELAYRIAAEVVDQKDTEGFGLFHSTSQWSAPMPPAAMAAARLMAEIGSLLDED
ncbi:hypothetical protein G6L37_00290 [Agrobacterium rubi]|nr:hypothetical protein [Agrobacterium rubi]NTF23827.1 hypothetical protein [Agrobacterium rubi]